MHLQSSNPHAHLLNGPGQHILYLYTTGTTSSDIHRATVGTVGLVDEDERGLLITRRAIRTRRLIGHAETKCANHYERAGLLKVVDSGR